MSAVDDLRARRCQLVNDLAGLELFLKQSGLDTNGPINAAKAEIARIEKQISQFENIVGDEGEKERGGVAWRAVAKN